jgi:hypothetical protein
MLSYRVKETSTTTGTGNFTLAGAVTNFETFNTAFSTDKTFYYTIVDDTNNTWEVGMGHLSASTTLIRDTVIASTNSDAAVNFGAATKDVFCSEHTANYGVVRTGAIMAPWGNSELQGANGTSLDANEVLYFPFFLCASGSFDAFAVNVATTGTNLRMGLYDVESGDPNNLIAVHDTSYDISAATGYHELSFDGGAMFLEAGWYYVGMASDGTPIFTSGYLDSAGISLLGVGTLMRPKYFLSVSRTYAAMPDPAYLTGVAVADTLEPITTGLVAI